MSGSGAAVIGISSQRVWATAARQAALTTSPDPFRSNPAVAECPAP